MEKELEQYLLTVEQSLKSLPASERIDIVKELKSYMEELQQKDKKSSLEIIEGLGSPKELARGYLGNAITKNTSFNIRKFLMILSFWGAMGLFHIWFIPAGLMIAAALIFAGIISPIAGLIKAIGFLLHIDISFIVFQIGDVVLHPFLGLFISIILGGLLYFLGKRTWGLVIRYIQSINKFRKVHFSS